ncbi:tripartite tricarboxylate transporter TctB [Allostella vacuolata]|nr:tripartite tricarboxylate transporter TctB [Stella vacuolata]
MIGIRDQQGLAGGLLLLAIAGGLGWAASSLAFGSVMAMGPGFLPQILAAVLGGFGAVMMMGSLTVAGPPLVFRRLPRLLAVLAALLCFAQLIEDWGLFLSALAVVLVSCAAADERRLARSLGLAGVLATIATILFVELLSLPLSAWPRF